jgi:hypothetical protein
MKILMATLVAFALAAPADDKRLGAGVTLDEATPIEKIVNAPADYVGKTVRVDGVATAVCEAMGCWMAIAANGEKDAPTVRLKVEHEGDIKFPMSAKGKKVSAQGTFEAIGAGDEHGREAAAEHAKHDPSAKLRAGAKASAQFHIKATGAIIR